MQGLQSFHFFLAQSDSAMRDFLGTPLGNAVALTRARFAYILVHGAADGRHPARQRPLCSALYTFYAFHY